MSIRSATIFSMNTLRQSISERLKKLAENRELWGWCEDNEIKYTLARKLMNPNAGALPKTVRRFTEAFGLKPSEDE